MDDILLKQLVRQLRVLNIWISIFGTLILTMLIILGILVFKVVTFVNDTNKKVDNFTSQTRRTLDVKQQACSSQSIGGVLKDKTNICNNN
jgi:hypothetical protein